MKSLDRDDLPLVSVITACYNSAETVVETIESIQRQTYPCVEHIVVDDGSTDGVAELLKSYIQDSRVVFIQRENGGVSSARNTGFAHSRGEYIVFLDADDLLRPEYVETCLRMLTENPEARIAVSGVEEFGVGKLMRQIPPFEFEKYVFDNTFPCCAMMRRKDFLRCGPYDESMSFAEDWSLFISILKEDPIVEISPELLVLRRRHENKKSLSAVADSDDALLATAFNAVYDHHKELYDHYITDRPLSLYLARRRQQRDSRALLMKLKRDLRVAVLALLGGGLLLIAQSLLDEKFGLVFQTVGIVMIAAAGWYGWRTSKSLLLWDRRVQ